MNFDFMEQRRNEQIFIIAFCIFILKNLLPVSSLVNYSNRLDLVMVLLFFVCIGYKLVTQKYSLYGFALLVMLTLLFAYSALTTQYYSIFYGFLCVIAMQKVDLIKVLKVSSTIKIIFILFHVFIYFSIFFLHPDTVELIERNGVSRHFFFLQHPNLFSAIVVWTCLEIIYIQYERMNFNRLLLIFLINLFLYQFTNTNTGLLIMAVVIVLILLEKQKGAAFQDFLTKGAKCIFPVLASTFIVLAAIYTKLSGMAYTLWHDLNEALTGRLLYGAYAFDQYRFSLIGRNAAFPDKSFWNGFWFDEIFFDNSYLYLFFIYGSVYLVIMSIVLYMLEKHLEPKEKIMVITLALFGVMEGYILNISLCFPLVLIGKYMFDMKFKSTRNEIVAHGQ